MPLKSDQAGPLGTSCVIGQRKMLGGFLQTWVDSGHRMALVQEEAARLLASPPADPDAERRRDFTQQTVYTVDDASTTEIDDGLSLERLPDGRTKVGMPGGWRHELLCGWGGRWG